MNKILQGNSLSVLKTLDAESVNCVVTSPPYWALRDYGVDGQLGQEKTPQDYVENLCAVFDEIARVLKKDGTVFINIGDTYGGSKVVNTETNKNKRAVTSNFVKNGGTMKSLCQIPSRFAVAMTDRGWILRNRIIWHKPNQMPQSVKDRFTVDYEDVFFFTKSPKYYFKQQTENCAMNSDVEYRRALRRTKEYESKQPYQGNFPKSFRDDGKRNMRTVWSIATKPYKDAHFATYPEALIEPMVKAGCPDGGVVLDPFFGAGTTGLVAQKQGKNWIGIELNPSYIEIAKKRLNY